MAHADIDDLADIFHGSGITGFPGLPTSLTLRDIHSAPRRPLQGVARAGGQSQAESQSKPRDSCDSCDSQATAQAGGPKQRLRPAATFCDRQAAGAQESQRVAGSRRAQATPQTRANPQESQESQKSQGSTREGAEAAAGCTATTAPEAWTPPAWSDADIAHFKARRDRLIRWGYSSPDAEALADRLTRRDLTDDDRVSCVDCVQYRPGQCGNHRAARLDTKEIGHDLVAKLQRCPGFQLTR